MPRTLLSLAKNKGVIPFSDNFSVLLIKLVEIVQFVSINFLFPVKTFEPLYSPTKPLPTSDLKLTISYGLMLFSFA